MNRGLPLLTPLLVPRSYATSKSNALTPKRRNIIRLNTSDHNPRLPYPLLLKKSKWQDLTNIKLFRISIMLCMLGEKTLHF